MSSPKRKILFNDTLRVRSTRSGSQYVRASEVITSKAAKEDIRQIRKAFSKSSSTNGNDQPKSDKKK